MSANNVKLNNLILKKDRVGDDRAIEWYNSIEKRKGEELRSALLAGLALLECSDTIKNLLVSSYEKDQVLSPIALLKVIEAASLIEGEEETPPRPRMKKPKILSSNKPKQQKKTSEIIETVPKISNGLFNLGK